MSDFRGTLNLFGPVGTGILSVVVVYLIPALFFLVVSLAFAECYFKKKGCWQAFAAAGFMALGVALLYLTDGQDEACDYVMAGAMIFASYSVILASRKKEN